MAGREKRGAVAADAGLFRNRTWALTPDEPAELETPCARDFRGWLPLWDGYNAFYGREGPTALPLEITRATWARFFDAYEPVQALVAPSGQVACVIQGAVEDRDYPALARAHASRADRILVPSAFTASVCACS